MLDRWDGKGSDIVDSALKAFYKLYTYRSAVDISAYRLSGQPKRSAARKFTMRGETVDKEAGFVVMRGKTKKPCSLTKINIRTNVH